MFKLSDNLTDSDLIFISRILIPDYSDKKRLLTILREDDEILDKMLSDPKLFKYIALNKETYLSISPFLFFSIVLRHMRNELSKTFYTIEDNRGYNIAVFDGKSISKFLKGNEILNYLAKMLASFTRIHNFSTTYRIRKGIWSRFRYSDFDIDSLIRYSRTLDEKLRFRPFKKIADLCLFILGIFPEYVETHEIPLAFGDRRLAKAPMLRRKGFESFGRYYYKTASSMETAYNLGLDKILSKLSEEFELAEKTLNYMSKHFIGFQRKDLFPPIESQ